MSNTSDEGRSDTGSDTASDEQVGIGDEQLPDDLKPSEDNPLAESLGDGESVDGLLDEGKDAEQSEGQPEEESDSGSSDSGEESDSD